MAKRGRKRTDYSDPETGKPVVGLSRLPDGRWRIIGTQIRYTEPDIRRAIDRFRQFGRRQKFAGLGLSPDDENLQFLMTPAAELVRNSAVSELARGFVLIGGDTEESWQRFWKYVADEIRSKPKLVAKLTGIEELAYLTRLESPERVPASLLRSTYEQHAKGQKSHRLKCLRAWDDFVKSLGIDTLDDITPKVVVAYRDNVHARGLKPKTQAHIFGSVRAVLSLAKYRNVAVKQIVEVEPYLSMLKPSGTAISIDPHPVEVADWLKLLEAAEGADKAMLLLMMNCAMYLIEAIRLRWDDIDFNRGVLVTNREKTGKPIRAAVLWPETLAALAELPREASYIFVSQKGSQLKARGGGDKRWAALAEKAKVKVTSSQIRDGAATAAAEEGASEQIQKLLLGHRCGMSDHYIRRSPQIVQPATDAVRRRYLPVVKNVQTRPKKEAVRSRR